MSAARGLPRAGLVATAVVGLLSASIALQVVRDTWYPRQAGGDMALYVPSGQVLDRMALSYDAVLADVYWIRAVQHFGRSRLATGERRRYDLLYPLLSIATTLDPLFNIAYRFGAIFLSEAPPGGPGRPDQAIELLKRGLVAQPTRWQYMQDIGFIYYWWLRDYRRAGEWFDKAAGVPGAPWWMKSMAANTLTLGGARPASRALWTALAQSGGDNPWLAREATRRLLQLDALDEADRLTNVAGRWRTLHGGGAATWESLVRAGAIADVPRDPAGTPYVLDASGVVRISPASWLQPMPDEPAGSSRPGDAR